MFDKLAKRLLQPVNTSVVSILGFFNALLGLWLLLPFTSISEQFSSPYIQEWELGILIMAIGLPTLLGSIFERLSMLKIGTLLGFSFWAAVTGAVLYAKWQSPGWIFSLMIAMYCGFVYVNIRINGGSR